MTSRNILIRDQLADLLRESWLTGFELAPATDVFSFTP